MLVTALFVGICCGLVGVLIDLDHVIAYKYGRECTNARLLHKPLGLAAGIIIISCIACIGRLYLRLVLGG